MPYDETVARWKATVEDLERRERLKNPKKFPPRWLLDRIAEEKAFGPPPKKKRPRSTV